MYSDKHNKDAEQLLHVARRFIVAASKLELNSETYLDYVAAAANYNAARASLRKRKA